ncbi:MAG: septum formation initiator family protein [Candidatus Doudnabacteria bacterium]|nr:septum formation initiator family protein [Candidatus Doudnabacteria bacterium]
MDFQALLKSRYIAVVLVLVFASVAFLTVELYWQKREVDSEISRLQQKAGELNKNNEQLSELIKYLDTPEYKEKEAREKLNLKREGEQVVVLPEPEAGNSVAGSSMESQSNPVKWFSYFFQVQ